MFTFFLVALGLSVMLVLVGGIAWYICTKHRPLLEFEREQMWRHGRLNGEEESMRDFRVARTDGELLNNERHTVLAIQAFVVGLSLFIVLFALVPHFGFASIEPPRYLPL